MHSNMYVFMSFIASNFHHISTTLIWLLSTYCLCISVRNKNNKLFQSRISINYYNISVKKGLSK